jgi:hypothetical protein
MIEYLNSQSGANVSYQTHKETALGFISHLATKITCDNSILTIFTSRHFDIATEDM